MTEGRTTRLAAAVLGLLLLSPLNLALFRVLPLGVVFLMDVVGIMLAIHGLPRAGTAVVLACVINVPLLWWVGAPEAGEWASLFAIPKYGIFLLAGWWSWSQRSGQGALFRWVGRSRPERLLRVHLRLLACRRVTSRGREVVTHAPPGSKRGAWSLGSKNVLSSVRFVEGRRRPPQPSGAPVAAR